MRERETNQEMEQDWVPFPVFSTLRSMMLVLESNGLRFSDRDNEQESWVLT